MGGLLGIPQVGDFYAGGVVTRRQRTPQGQIRLLVNNQWLNFDPHSLILKMAETSAGDDIGIKLGDTVTLVNPDCWEAERWPGGVTAKVMRVSDDGTRLTIATPESERQGFTYGVDAVNWRRVALDAPVVALMPRQPRCSVAITSGAATLGQI